MTDDTFADADHPAPKDIETVPMEGDPEWIADEVKRALKLRSDYKLAQALKVDKATVSKWRTGKGGMSDSIALRAAALLGRDPLAFLLLVQAHRTESVGASAVLMQGVRLLERMGRRALPSILLAVTFVFGATFLPSHQAVAGDSGRDSSVYPRIHYTWQNLRRRRSVRAVIAGLVGQLRRWLPPAGLAAVLRAVMRVAA